MIMHLLAEISINGVPMGLFNLFSGKSPAEYERKGDALARDNAWGDAKLAYETGLEKLTKGSSNDPALVGRLQDKLHQSKEALAKAHHQEAIELLDAGCTEDAQELLTLAIELTDDPQLREDISQKIGQTTVEYKPVIQAYEGGVAPAPNDPGISADHEDTDDYFSVLMGALPEDIQQAYRDYGHQFEQGYLALNRGDFELAIECLSRAAEENPSTRSLVPLELATAYVNLGQGRQAKALLETLIQHRPDVLPAYQLLCDIYWEDKDFDKAMRLLDTLPPDLAESMAAFEIRGETLLQAARYEDAKSYFQDLFQTHGWKDSVALGLARSHEALGQTDQARDVYGQFISQCGSGCGTRVDPWIKRKYADLNFDIGNYTAEILEYYLELSREDPANTIPYCQRISRIYAELGNDAEARRFQSIAEDLARD